ncbi:5' nucleotidase, NT5C type [Nesterenkonia alba]|uniref:5' nucleotidase, NT5C type n=1 Tax=Nesterenkonia alba TaxID=515814 RepID=UPI0003B61487|nr:hypothetical protein [Nesterenkonia alba]
MFTREHKVIGLDLDNTYTDFTGGLRNFIAHSDNLDVRTALTTLPTPDGYDCANWDFTDSSFKTFVDAFKAAEKQGIYSKLAPLPHAQQACYYLVNAGYRFVAITARKEQHRKHTEQWVQEHAPFVDGVIHSDDKASWFTGNGGFIDLFIDDSPAQIADFREQDVPHIIFNQLYNEDFIVNGSTLDRIVSWKHAPLAVRSAFDFDVRVKDLAA